MLNNHEVNLTDEEAAAEVARVAKTYPVVRLLSADQIKSEPNCLLAGDRCPCLRQSSLEALAGSDEISERLLNDGVEYRRSPAFSDGGGQASCPADGASDR